MNTPDPSQNPLGPNSQGYGPQDGVPAWFGPVVSGLAGLALVAGLGLRSAQENLQAETRIQPSPNPSAWVIDVEPESEALELSQLLIELQDPTLDQTVSEKDAKRRS